MMDKVKMTNIEHNIWEILPQQMKSCVHVDLSYQRMLSHVHDHLVDIFGTECINWKREISSYLDSEGCHIANSCNDIPEISLNEIQQLVECEREYAPKACRLQELELEDGMGYNSDKLKEAATLLGLLPNVNKGMLSYMIQFPEQFEHTFADENELRKLGMTIKSLIDAYRPGFQYTYPIIETAMTQPKTQYYYRGENAYYGTSKAGMFRTKNTRVPEYVSGLVDKLRLNEGCGFLENFDAVKQWGYSNINYMALAQHYGLRTPMLDITGDIMTALFFACCKYGPDGKWHPLENSDFENADSRKVVADRSGDSRYGILYMCPTEIQDMALLYDEDKGNCALPVGYQPFMRCKCQYAYMYLTKDSGYDLLKDPMFLKVKFRLTREICDWVYEEMKCGESVYPQRDIPDLTPYFSKINQMRYFSKKLFEEMMDTWNFSGIDRERVKAVLQKYGFSIVDGKTSIISSNQLRKINRKYPVEKAFEYTGISPVTRPCFVVT